MDTYSYSWNADRSKYHQNLKRFSDYRNADSYSTLPILNINFQPEKSSNKHTNLRKDRQFEHVKNFDANFTISSQQPCAVPFQSTQKLKYTFNDSKLSYRNCLGTCYLQDELHYWHSDFKKDYVELKLSKFINSKRIKKCYLENSKTILNCKSIKEIQAVDYCNSNCAVVCSDNNVYHITISEDFINTDKILVPNIQSCCLNPTLSNQCTVGTNDGVVKTYNLQRKYETWSCTISDDEKLLNCEYGNHPSYLGIGTSACVWLADLRQSEQSNKKLFDMEYLKHQFLNKESVCSFKFTDNQPFFYVNCTETVALMDTRYCKYPVITWQHMLRNPPIYPIVYDDNSMLCLTDPKNIKLCFIASSWELGYDTDVSKVQAYDLPNHLNILKDLFSFTNSNSIWFSEEVKLAMQSPILGISVSRLINNELIMCFQNASNNMFYQFLSYEKSRSSSDVAEDKENLNAFKILEAFENKCFEDKLHGLKQTRPTIKSVQCPERNPRKTKNWLKVVQRQDFKGILLNLSKKLNVKLGYDEFLVDRMHEYVSSTSGFSTNFFTPWITSWESNIDPKIDMYRNLPLDLIGKRNDIRLMLQPQIVSCSNESSVALSLDDEVDEASIESEVPKKSSSTKEKYNVECKKGSNQSKTNSILHQELVVGSQNINFDDSDIDSISFLRKNLADKINNINKMAIQSPIVKDISEETAIPLTNLKNNLKDLKFCDNESSIPSSNSDTGETESSGSVLKKRKGSFMKASDSSSFVTPRPRKRRSILGGGF